MHVQIGEKLKVVKMARNPLIQTDVGHIVEVEHKNGGQVVLRDTETHDWFIAMAENMEEYFERCK